MTDTPSDNTRRVVAAFDHAAGRLHERGVSKREIGEAMVAVGLSILSQEVAPEHLATRLATLTANYAAVVGLVDAEPGDHPQPARH